MQWGEWCEAFIVGSSLVNYDGGQNVTDKERSVEEEQKPREPKSLRELASDWRPNREQWLQAVRIAVVVAITLLGILVLLWVISILFGVKLMDLLKILAVPITVGAAVTLLNYLQKRRELAIEAQRARDAAAQQYLDQLTQLLLDKKNGD